MALIVLPLALALLWLGWRSVNSLEQRGTNQRVAALEMAVERFMTEGLRTVVSVGQTLADGPSFNATENPMIDEERRRQLIAMLGRHPVVQAGFVGYDDGSFIYAGRLGSFSIAQRLEFDAPDGESLIVRIIADGRESWWFYAPDGKHGPAKERLTDFDPRTRPWYIEAMKVHGPILTQPYRFARDKR